MAQADGREHHSAWQQSADLVVADVPCSGLGIIRKKPDIRYKDPDTMQSLPKLQLEILKNQSRYVKPGGVLLYSTCTLLKRENEDVVERFLMVNKDFCLCPTHIAGDDKGCVTFLPHKTMTDGFFVAKLMRKTEK